MTKEDNGVDFTPVAAWWAGLDQSTRDRLWKNPNMLEIFEAGRQSVRTQKETKFVSQPPLTVVPQPDYTGGFPIITCGTGSTSSDSCTTADSNLTGIQCFNNV